MAHQFKKNKAMKRICIIIGLLTSLYIVRGQVGIDPRDYKFGEIPTTTEAEDQQFKDYQSATLKDCHLLYYNITKTEIELWELYHFAHKIYTQEGLEKFNSITYRNTDIKSFKNFGARIIRNNEVIKEYNLSHLTKVVNEEEDEDETTASYELKFTDLAIGDIIEYFRIGIRPRINESETYFLQEYVPCKNIDYTIVLPDQFKPHLQLYNADYPVLDTIISDKGLRYTTIHIPSLPVIPNEPLAHPSKYLARVEYILAYNYGSGSQRVNTTKGFVNGFYESSKLNDSDLIKVVKKHIIKRLKLNKKDPLEQKLRTIETILKNELYGINGITQLRIYRYVLDHFKINYEVVLTTNKTKKTFDKNFNGTNFNEEVLLYFPEIDQYIAPEYYALRLGLTPAVLIGNEGLFLKKAKIGKTELFTYYYSTISVPKKERTKDNIVLSLDFSSDLKTLYGKIKREMSGYMVSFLQTNYNFFEVEDKEQLVDELMTLSSDGSLISDEKFTNTSPQDVGVNPFIGEGSISNSSWVKMEGDDIIILVGEMIGKQSKIESEKPRVLPVERNYLSSYKRSISIKLPQGYKVDDIDQYQVEVYDNDDPKKAKAVFTAHFKVENDVLKVESIEYYDQLYHDVEAFPLIARVVNSAAEFNELKVRLVKK